MLKSIDLTKTKELIKVIKENFGLIVEQHQTLAPKDAYSAHGGYIAERGANAITYSKDHGEVSRVTVRP